MDGDHPARHGLIEPAVRRSSTWAGLVIVAAAATTPAPAQQHGMVPMPFSAVRPMDATAGSPSERTTLLLSLLSPSAIGTALRPLHVDVAAALSRIPHARDTVHTVPALAFSHPTAQVWYNSQRAAEANDGAVWQGRGLTAAISGGVGVHFRLLSFAARPLAFVAQNAAFTPFLSPTDPDDFTSVITVEADRPYRFGGRPYARLHPGESWLRIGPRQAAIGATTASQQWGPMHHFPLMMGTEAAGFPRVFAEIRSTDVGVGRIDAHWLVGRLEASPVADLASGARSRLATAFLAAVTPRWLPGLQVGASRFFHVRWRPGVLHWNTVSLPFVGLLKRGNPTDESTSREHNQVASVFTRVAPPGSGVEVYGELFREDHNWDERDLAGEPDHASGYGLGIRRSWMRGDIMRALTIESVNSRTSHLARVRLEQPLHIHGAISEGHTYLGQPIGSSNVMGGGGLIVAYDRVAEARSYTVQGEIRRTAQDREGGSWNGRQTGIVAFRIGRADHMDDGVRSLMLGVEQGFGYERGLNATLSASWRLDSIR